MKIVLKYSYILSITYIWVVKNFFGVYKMKVPFVVHKPSDTKSSLILVDGKPVFELSRAVDAAKDKLGHNASFEVWNGEHGFKQNFK